MRFVFSAMRASVTHMSWPKAGISGHQTARESLALRQEARTRRFGGRAAGGSHKSARGVPEISIFNQSSPDSRRFRDKVAPLAGLGNQQVALAAGIEAASRSSDGAELLKRADLAGSKTQLRCRRSSGNLPYTTTRRGRPTTGLAPVTLAPLVGQLPAAAAPVDPMWTLPVADQPAGGTIEVELPSGVKLRLTGAVDEAALHRVDRQRVVVTVALKKLSLWGRCDLCKNTTEG